MKIKALKGPKRYFKGSKCSSCKIKAFKGFKGSLRGLILRSSKKVFSQPSHHCNFLYQVGAIRRFYGKWKQLSIKALLGIISEAHKHKNHGT